MPTTVESFRYKKVVKAKKRPQPTSKYLPKSQEWRERWKEDQIKKVAESFRSFISYSTSKRQLPMDTRYAPFDREEKDGVYHVMQYLMADPLRLSNNHAPVVKRLCCNVGLMGPMVNSHRRMWKPTSFASLPEKSTKASDRANRPSDVSAGVYADPV